MRSLTPVGKNIAAKLRGHHGAPQGSGHEIAARERFAWMVGAVMAVTLNGPQRCAIRSAETINRRGSGYAVLRIYSRCDVAYIGFLADRGILRIRRHLWTLAQ